MNASAKTQLDQSFALGRRAAAKLGRIARAARDAANPSTASGGSILDAYVRDAPSAQLAVDVFKGEWASKLPIVGVTSGEVPLFDDGRVKWFIDQLGGSLADLKILELGPLEAGHTRMMEEAGASVLAIEGNTRAYLKCLVVKEVLNMQNSQFLLGDFLPYLESTDERFDLLLASGVIYHAPDPVRLLEAMGRTSDRVAIWTHYYDKDVIDADPSRRRLFQDEPVQVMRGPRDLTLHRRRYLEALESDGFCGRPEESALWMEKEGLLGVLQDVGFEHITIESVDLEHPFGPCLTMMASKL